MIAFFLLHKIAVIEYGSPFYHLLPSRIDVFENYKRNEERIRENIRQAIMHQDYEKLDSSIGLLLKTNAPRQYLDLFHQLLLLIQEYTTHSDDGIREEMLYRLKRIAQSKP